MRKYKIKDALLMFRSPHDWPCKLLLMCHRLEPFIGRDEPGHRGARFDLWPCI